MSSLHSVALTASCLGLIGNISAEARQVIPFKLLRQDGQPEVIKRLPIAEQLWFASIKDISLADGTRLDFGGELRWNWEGYNNLDFQPENHVSLRLPFGLYPA